MEKVMTMSQDVWRILCTKVYDLKSTNAGGNKIKEPWCHPSSPWDAQEASSRVQSKKESTLIIDTKYGSLLQSRHPRQSNNHGDRLLEPCYSLLNQWWWPWNQGCTTRRSEDHKIKIIDIFGSIRKKSLLSSIFCSTSEANSSIFLDIQKLHEVPIPTNQEPSQSEIPTSRYGQNIEGSLHSLIWPSTLHSLIGISSNIVPLL